MKCQNCGQNEVNFHYSSNVNGCVTETHLCSECASKSGYSIGQFIDIGSVFDRFFPVFGGSSGFIPASFPMLISGAAFPVTIGQHPAPAAGEGLCSCGHEKCVPDAGDVKVDDEMKRRREINVLKEQMRCAAEKDDFEKAIELREKINEMERSQ